MALIKNSDKQRERTLDAPISLNTQDHESVRMTIVVVIALEKKHDSAASDF